MRDLSSQIADGIENAIDCTDVKVCLCDNKYMIEYTTKMYGHCIPLPLLKVKVDGVELYDNDVIVNGVLEMEDVDAFMGSYGDYVYCNEMYYPY